MLRHSVRRVRGYQFGQHPDAEIIASQSGPGPILGARALAELGDVPSRYATAKARKNYAGTSPIARASGKKKSVAAGASVELAVAKRPRRRIP